MSFWAILGIDPTDDKSAIKEAYINQLSLHNPEDDPEGFQVLRQAYENALKVNMKHEKYDEDIDPEENVLQESPIQNWISKINTIYDDFFKRIDENNWYNILEEDVCYEIDTSKEASYELLTFLMKKYYLPHKIWVILNEHFLWSDKRDSLYRSFSADFINFIMDNIIHDSSFRYDLFKTGTSIDYDSYIKTYYDADHQLNIGNIYNARKALDSCIEIYPYHPDTRILNGRYYLAVNWVARAIEIFSSVIEEYGNNFYVLFNRANAFLRLGKINEAYDDYDRALSLNSDNINAIYKFADCCFSMKKFQKAKELFHILMDKYPYNSEIKAKFLSCSYYLIDRYTAEPDSKYKLARCYFDVNEFQKCHDILENIANDSHADFNMYLLLGNVLRALKQNKKAEMYIDESIKLNPGNWEAYYSEGLLFEDMDRYEEALDSYNKASLMYADSPMLHDNRGNVLCKLGRFEDAIESYKKSIALNPNMPHVYVSKIRALSELELYDGAVRECNIALDIFPYYPDLHINKIKTLFTLKKYKEALDSCSKALESNIDDSSIYYYKALTLVMLDNIREAIDTYHMAIKLDPNNADYCYQLACSYCTQNEYETAIEFYTRALEINPEYIDSYNDRAFAYRKLGNINMAEQDFKKVLEIDPENMKAYNNLATLYGELKDFKKSVEYYTKAIELNSDNSYETAYAFNGRGFSYKNMKQYNKAISDYKHALKVHPDFLISYNNLGILYLDDLNNYDEALKYFKMSVETSPDYHAAYNNIGLLYDKLKEYDKSIKYMLKAVSMDPDSELYNLNTAIIYAHDKNYIKAAEYYERVLQINPDNVRVKKVLKKIKKKLE